MTSKTRFLVDECFLGPLPTIALNEFVLTSETKLDFEFVTIGQEFGLGVKDEDWIPRLLDQPYIVITVDRGRSSQEKLPTICVENRVTHVLFSPSFAKKDRNEKVASVITILKSLRKCSLALPGSRFNVRPKGNKITVDLCKATEARLKLLNKQKIRDLDEQE